MSRLDNEADHWTHTECQTIDQTQNKLLGETTCENVKAHNLTVSNGDLQSRRAESS